MKKILLTCSIVAAVMLTFCASAAKSRAKHSINCSEKIHQAIAQFDKKKYASAQYLLTDVMEKCPGAMNEDSLLMYLGKSLLGIKKPDEAKTEFSRLVQSFPLSPLAEEAYYLVGYSAYRASSPSYLDQTSTKEAMQTLQNVIDRYPGSPYADSAKVFVVKCAEKLAEKEFINARYYESIDRFESAIVYFKYIIAEYPSSSFALQSKLLMSQDLFKLNRNDEANTLLDQLIEQTDNTTAAQNARKLKTQYQH